MTIIISGDIVHVENHRLLESQGNANTTLNAEEVTVTEDTLTAELADGRTISVPLAWYPRLDHATQQERENWEFIGGGQGIHWPDLDEDLSVEGLIMGRASGESQRSFKRWLEAKQAGRSVALYDLMHADREWRSGE